MVETDHIHEREYLVSGPESLFNFFFIYCTSKYENGVWLKGFIFFYDCGSDHPGGISRSISGVPLIIRHNHNYNNILENDWLSAGRILAFIRQFMCLASAWCY